MQTDPVPDEAIVRKTIAERSRELRLLRSIERALARYRREQGIVERARVQIDATHATEHRAGGDHE